MADREKLIELIAPVLRCLPWGQVSSHTAGDIADSLIAIGVTIPEWIPVTERLPLTREVQWDDLRYMESDLVLGFGGDGIAVVKHTRELGTDRWLWIDIDGNAWPVTHWMPLPEPPKGE